MNKRMIFINIIVTCLLAVYLIIELINPLGSLFLLLSMVVLAIVGLCSSIYGIKKEERNLLKAVFVLNIITSALMLILFAFMLIMGQGA